MINNRQGGRRRGRGGGGRAPGSGPNIGNRQDNRQRGNAAQLLEKYRGLARDAQMAGDRIQSEYYLQFADHYFRVLNENRARFEEHRRGRDEEFADDEDVEEELTLADGDAGEDDGETEERQARPRREDRFERADRPDRQGRRERRDRDGRGERPRRDGAEPHPPREVAASGEGAELNAQAQGEEGARPRRGRPRRSEGEASAGEARLALDILPPSISSLADEGGEDAPKAPRRRTRRPRGEEEIAPAA